jgi:hypothetical protein
VRPGRPQFGGGKRTSRDADGARARGQRRGYVQRRVTNYHRRHAPEIRAWHGPAVPGGGAAPCHAYEFGAHLVVVAVRPDAQVQQVVQSERGELHLGHRADVAGEHRLVHAAVEAGSAAAPPR